MQWTALICQTDFTYLKVIGCTAIAQSKEYSTVGVQSDIRALCLWLVVETGYGYFLPPPPCPQHVRSTPSF